MKQRKMHIASLLSSATLLFKSKPPAGTPDLLALVLRLSFVLLRALLLLQQSQAHQSVLGLKLDEIRLTIIDQRESRRFSPTESCAHTEHDHILRLGVQVLCNLRPDVVLGDIRLVRVDDVDHALLPGEKRVADKLAQLNGC